MSFGDGGRVFLTHGGGAALECDFGECRQLFNREETYGIHTAWKHRNENLTPVPGNDELWLYELA